MAGKFTLEAVFKAVDRMSGPVARMAAGLDKFQQKASKGLKTLDENVGRVTGTLKSMALVAAGVSAAAGAVAFNIGKTGADFEQAITNVGAVSLTTRGQIADLEKKALDLGATTKFSATEVAQAMEMMGKAGFTNSQVMEGIGGILAAAAAEGAGLEETASNISNVLKGMGLETSQTARVADVLTLASARTNSSISSLGESMKNVSSTARQLGVPLEDTVGMVALLQDVGLDASEAGSAVATMLTHMSAPSKAAAAQMKALGVSFQDAKGNMLAPAKVLEQLAKGADKSGGNMKQVAFFAELVGLRGQKAALNLQELFKKGKYKELTDELANAAGSAEKMASIRMDTFMGDIETLGGSVDSLKIALFSTQSGPLRDIVKGTTAWLDANSQVMTSGFVDFIKTAIPILQGFGEGVRNSFRDIAPLAKGAAEAIGSIFGSDGMGAQSQAYFFGRTITKVGFALLGVVVVTKLASAAVFAFGAVTKAAQAAVWLFRAALWVAQGALAAYQFVVGGGIQATIRMAGTVASLSGMLIEQKIASIAAAGGFGAMLIPLAAVALAIGAIYIAWKQLQTFMDENGGFEGVKGFLGIGTDDFGFEGVDQVMNRQARNRAQADRVEPAQAATPFLSADPNKAAAVDRLFGTEQKAFGPNFGAGVTPRAPSPQDAPQAEGPQVVSPFGEMNAADFKNLFDSTIKLQISDPGKVVEGVQVKSPNKTLAPPTGQSGTP